MSALGQKQTSAHVRVMSALPSKADILHCKEGRGNSITSLASVRSDGGTVGSARPPGADFGQCRRGYVRDDSNSSLQRRVLFRTSG